MRTSNYIVAAFLIAVAGVTLGLFIAAKRHQKKQEPMNLQTYMLPELSVVVAMGDADFIITQGENNYWTQPYKDDKIFLEDWYQVSGDTLFVLSTPNPQPTLIVADLPKIMARDSSRVSIRGTCLGDLFIDADRAKININNSSQETREYLGGLNIWIRLTGESSVQLNNVDADLIDIVADNGSVRMYNGQIGTIVAELSNNSLLRIPKVAKKIAVEKDESSTFTAY